MPTFLSIPTVPIYWYLASTDFRHPIKCDNIIYWAKKYTCGARIVRLWKDWNNMLILIDDRIDDAWFSFVQFIHFDIIRSIDSMNSCNNFSREEPGFQLGIFECIPWKTQFSDSFFTALFWFNAPQLNFWFLYIFFANRKFHESVDKFGSYSSFIEFEEYTLYDEHVISTYIS